MLCGVTSENETGTDKRYSRGKSERELLTAKVKTAENIEISTKNKHISRVIITHALQWRLAFVFSNAAYSLYMW